MRKDGDVLIDWVIEDGAIMPKYATINDAGMDLCILNAETIIPGECKVLKTGVRCAMLPGYHFDMRARSGLSIQYPNYLANGVGTIDNGYRGDISIIFVNNAANTVIFKRGTKLAQLVLRKQYSAVSQKVDSLNDTDRGYNGFGSSGLL